MQISRGLWLALLLTACADTPGEEVDDGDEADPGQLKDIGDSCRSGSECASGYCANGAVCEIYLTCHERPTTCLEEEDICQGGDCCEGLACIPVVCGPVTVSSTCQRPREAGESCQRDFQCASGLCARSDCSVREAQCVAKGPGCEPAGTPCNTSRDCCEGLYCSARACSVNDYVLQCVPR